ncbi:mucoidy inhibitor MuiA family protein [Chamaesiphon sp. VAR_48_metabat_135_sub]|uniref:mucoidy inhibitor MuiA family protein n=1 Tax=Chamaesiphon sp. VAR_48_metabat_135_sub TaxID=2964699 RepID=UPI00286B69CD|nr:mucoidy inhibitor MuiA family protein [Chamaesiphon sp. VAR_48_metabat_135_sub]
MSLSIDTEIAAVTVYTDRALVTRQGKISLAGTERELTVSNLPTTLDPESVRVGGKGQIGVKLQAVTVDRQYTTEPVVDRIAQLTVQIEQLGADKRRLQAQIDTIKLQANFIQGLREKTQESFSRSLARQQIGLEDTQNFLDFIGTKTTEYAFAGEDLRQQQQQIDKQLQSLRLQLEEVETPYSKESFEISIAIEPAGAGEFQLELSYVVKRAYWTPLYDLRVQSTSKTIQLNYLAEIVQTTGEDWANVNLILSTAKPGLGTLPPKLDPWYIDAPVPMTMRSRNIGSKSSDMAMEISASAPMLVGAKMARMQEPDTLLTMEYEAETVVAEISQQGSVVTFQLGGGGNIPSDGNPHKVTIFNDNFACQFEYIAMPRLVSFAYLQAKAKNRSDGATLLPGKANIFRDDVFVGTSNLENIAPGQEFKLNLGIDEGIKIDRELIERQVDKTFLSGNRRTTYAYRLSVTNLLNGVNHISINDQIPHSRNEQIKVKLIKINPQIQPGELGRLAWEIDLPAHSKTEINYQFSIEHPENIHVQGLDI